MVEHGERERRHKTLADDGRSGMMMPNYHTVGDREPLLRLESGMEIVRAIKHEPIDLRDVDAGQLVRRTNAKNGSKFAGTWTLEVLIEWLRSEVESQGWRFPPGANARVRRTLDEVVGVSEGKAVRTITVVASGRYVHAYPDKGLK